MPLNHIYFFGGFTEFTIQTDVNEKTPRTLGYRGFRYMNFSVFLITKKYSNELRVKKLIMSHYC